MIGISMHYFNALEDICLVLGSQSYEELLFDILGGTCLQNSSPLSNLIVWSDFIKIMASDVV